MGDYLYSRAVIELVRLDDLEPLRVLSRVTNEMTVGEMRQLLAHEPLEFSEESVRPADPGQDGLAAVGRLRGRRAPRARRRSARRSAASARRWGWPSRSWTTCSTTSATRSVTGKPTGSDLREHKVTLPLIAALPRMDAAGRRRVDALMDTPEPGRRADRRGHRDGGRGRRARLRAGAGAPPGPAGRRRARRCCRRRRRGTRSGPASPTSWIAGADGRAPIGPGSTSASSWPGSSPAGR